MLQFLGVNFSGRRACTTVVDQKARLIQEASVPIQGITSLSRPGIYEVPPQEWIRAGGLALRDAYFSLPVKFRRIWGAALAGPQGWIGIDPDLDPATPLRLTPGASPIADLRAWLEEHPREQKRLFAILSPKDYFRFRISGALAADLTQASQTGLLLKGKSFWSSASLKELGLPVHWFPPVFDCAAITGRLNDAGMETTGIPEGIWLVAGADSVASSEFSANAAAGRQLYVLLDEKETRLRFALPQEAAPAPLEGWELVQNGRGERLSLSREVQAHPDAARDENLLLAQVEGALGALRLAGLAPSGLMVDFRAGSPPWLEAFRRRSPLPAELAIFAGRQDPGPAFFAGLAKRSFRDPGDLFLKIQRAHHEIEHQAPEETAT